MSTLEKTMITVEATIDAPVEKVWFFWTDPKHIIHWNNASQDWHTVRSLNDLQVGGRFLARMEARDGSQGFDFSGEYTKIVLNKQIFYKLDDDREVRVVFTSKKNNQTTVTETFEAEHTFTAEIQKTGWQSILDNFKKYVEDNNEKRPEHYEILINANPERVYQTVIGPHTYSQWTAEFNPTSHYIGSWDKGSVIKFIGNDEERGEMGMLAKIRENIPNKFISIEYKGLIQNGKEIFSGPEIDEWLGAKENYLFVPEEGGTKFIAEIETKNELNEETKTYFREKWPKAIKRLKELCEQ